MLEDINIYENSYIITTRKQPIKIISWITILIITLLIFLIIFFNFKYNKTLNYYTNIIEKEGEYYAILNMDKILTKTFMEKSILKVSGEEVNYEIVEINDNYINDEIVIKPQLKEEPKKIIEIEIILNAKTLYEALKERI